MPEIKRLFNASKMNRDLDDRLVPPGEYREALNINVSNPKVRIWALLKTY